MMDAQRPGAPSQTLVVFTMAFLVFPLLAVIPASFTNKRYLSMPDGAWSLQHYQTLFNNSEWLNSIGVSLFVGIIVSVIATAFALSFGLGIWYLRSRWTTFLVGLVLMPMAVPPVVSAMVMYFLETTIGQLIPSFGYDSMGGLMLAHVVMVVPYGVITILVVLSQLDRRLEMASRNVGASLSQTTFFIIIPNIRYGIASTMLLSFILSWEEIAVTLFITSVDVVTLPRRIWGSLRDAFDPMVASISVVLIVLTVVAVFVRSILPLVWRMRQSAVRETPDLPRG